MKHVVTAVAIALLTSSCGYMDTKSVAQPEQQDHIESVDGLANRSLSADKKQMLEWATSSERLGMYVDYEIAKWIVADALQTGRLGTPLRLMQNGEWHSGLEGPGTLAVNIQHTADITAPEAFVTGWIRADGTIDTARGITTLSLDAGLDTQGVTISDVTIGQEAPYGVSVDGSDIGDGPVTISCLGIQHDCTKSNAITPATEQDFRKLDREALDALNESMSKLFGEGWRGK